MNTLQKKYEEDIRPFLMKEFNYQSTMAAPRLAKVTLNMGLGDCRSDRRVLDFDKMKQPISELALIAGQKPLVTTARKSIAAFAIRNAGEAVGCKVTLRRERMYEFIERLISVAIPRMRDFRGLNPRSFDGRGNFSMGIVEQIIFPEIDYDKIDKIRGLDVTITTTSKTDEEGLALLRAFSFPFRN